ncbi:hypothetical protein [Jatrophihabitans fulvus]
MSQRDRALEELTSEFPLISAKVVVAMFLRYIEATDTLAAAVAATRARIIDACAVC